MADEASSKGKLRAPPLPWVSPSYSELKENLLPRILEREPRLANIPIEAAIEEVWRKIQVSEIPHRVVGLDKWSTWNPPPRELQLGIGSAAIAEAGWQYVDWHEAVIALPSRKPYGIEVPSERLMQDILPWLHDEEYRRRPPRPPRANPAAPLTINSASSSAANVTINMQGAPTPTDQPAATPRAPGATTPDESEQPAPDDKIEQAQGKPAATPHPRRNYTKDDAKLIALMHKAVTRKRNPAKDATDAARQLVKVAQGDGTDDSKVKRLVDRYYKTHPKK